MEIKNEEIRTAGEEEEEDLIQSLCLIASFLLLFFVLFVVGVRILADFLGISFRLQ